MKISSSRILLIIISLFLIIMPFFWLKPGEMDLGGDGGRLYFYDPINQIKNLAFYYVSPFNIGVAEASFYYLPFFLVLAGLKCIINSSYILISLNNAIKLTVGFLAMYAIIKEFIGRKNNNGFFVELASILAGLFYLSTPGMTDNYVKALPSHNQVFLNPLMFYLLLRFFLTGSMRYAWVILVTSLIFAPSFGYTAAPPFFAFFPLGFIFIFIYCKFLRKVKIPWKKLLLVFLLFLGLHAFHLVPEILDVFTSGSNTNLRLSTSDIPRQIGYFYGVLPIPKLSFHLLSYSLIKELAWASIVIPIIAVFGLLLNKKREKTIILVAVFFLITFFLVTGKVSVIGIKFYEWLFYIPGFTMFRNFYGQWQFVFYFFYALFFGLAIFSILQKVRFEILSKIIFFVLVVYFIISSWQFINGNLVNPFREEANGVRGAIIMDPEYEEALNFIRSLEDDGKVLVLPFTDSYAQVIHGLNGDGAFVGHTTIGQLTGKKDFAGYQDMSSYSAKFWELSKEKDYEGIKKLLGILNIRYVFYNSDTRIYDTTFPARPYSQNYVRKYMPPSQAEYGEYIRNIASEKIYGHNFYNIYKIDDKAFLSHFYIPDKILVYKNDPSLDIYSKASAFFTKDTTSKPLFMESQACKALFAEKLCDNKVVSMESNLPKIQFEKVNPTKYRVKVFNSTKPYILTFLEAFHKNWKVYLSNQNSPEGKITNNYFDGNIQQGVSRNVFFDKNTFETIGMKWLSEKNHFVGNGYANAWLISPKDVQGRNNYELIIEMTGQRAFYISLGISIVIFIGFLLWGVKLFFFKEQNGII